MVLDNKKGVFNKETLKDIHAITEKLSKVSDVVRVDSLANFSHVMAFEDDVLVDDLVPEDLLLTAEEIQRIKKTTLDHQTLPGTFFSRDGKSTLFIARLKPHFGEQPNHAPVMKQIDDIIHEFSANKDYTFHKFGTATVTEAFRVIAESDLMVMPLF